MVKTHRSGIAPTHVFTLCLALGTLSLPLSGCGDDEATGADISSDPDAEGFPRLEGEYAANCEGFTRRLRDCGLLTEGPVKCDDPEDSFDQCFFECMTTASCSLLSSSQCLGSAPPLARCLSFCDYHECDGGETYVPYYYVCNNWPDCADGADELDCQYFQCGSGETLNADYVCNAALECLDGSDEAGCPRFECGTGATIPIQWVCDFEDDCGDGTDEAGCDHITCESDGRELPASWRCDLEDDCLDGSDEYDCAQFLCR